MFVLPLATPAAPMLLLLLLVPARGACIIAADADEGADDEGGVMLKDGVLLTS